MSNFKVGDIVKWWGHRSQPVYRGIIVKTNGEEATVLWFDSGERLTDLTLNLVKVEERGT